MAMPTMNAMIWLRMMTSEQADGGKCPAEQKGAEISADHRAPVELAQQCHGDRIGQGGQQQARHKTDTGQEFSENHLPERDRKGIMRIS